MYSKKLYERFTPAYQTSQNFNRPDVWLIVQKDKVLVRHGSDLPLHMSPKIREMLDAANGAVHFLGQLDETDCFCAAVPDTAEAPPGYELVALRQLADQVDQAIFLLAGRAVQILHWDRLNQFCGRCGSPTRLKDDERARQCENCGNVIYPRISPAIIIAIIRGDEILLAHNRYFRNSMYSLVAGFMEPGEDFEDTAEREVCEEVGVQIKNVRYFASQPWPFPDSLMVGLVADYAGGDIVVDNKEIEHAAWFRRGELPEVPSTISIAGRMIRAFEDGHFLG